MRWFCIDFLRHFFIQSEVSTKSILTRSLPIRTPSLQANGKGFLYFVSGIELPNARSYDEPKQRKVPGEWRMWLCP